MSRVKINLRAYATRWRRQRRESLAERKSAMGERHWLEACCATHSLLAAPAAPTPAGPVPAPTLVARLPLGHAGPRPRPRLRRLHGEPVLLAVITIIIEIMMNRSNNTNDVSNVY